MDVGPAHVVVASRDGVLTKTIEELLRSQNIKSTKIADQLDLVQLLAGILAASHDRVLLILDGELGKGRTRRREDMDRSTIGLWEADSIIDQHTSAYETTTTAEKNAELVLHLLTYFTEEMKPYILVSEAEKPELMGGDFDDTITFVSESEGEEGEYWSTVIQDFLHPKESASE